MLRTRRVQLFIFIGCSATIAVLIFVSPSMLRSFFYPKPRGLPPIVKQTTEQLLAKLHAVLETNAPIVAQSLQRGLSDAQIQELEAQGGFRLSDDLRALYRWHNGMPTNSTVGLLPGQRFLPLEQVVRERALVQQEVKSATAIQRAAFSIVSGHRTPWIHVLDDGAGDGYFYDPMRADTEGAFFYHFAEVSHYLWFPSLRNFLAGAIECYESRAVKIATDGKGLEEDSGRSQKIWRRFAKSSEDRN